MPALVHHWQALSDWQTLHPGMLNAVQEVDMTNRDRISFDTRVMGGKPCIRGTRVTVGTIVGLMASGHSKEKILESYPYLESQDIDAALKYAAWRAEEIEISLGRQSA